MVKEYSLYDNSDINDNSNNANDDISLDAPPFLAYWVSFDDLQNSEGDNIINSDWNEDDLIVLDQVNFSSLISEYIFFFMIS